MLEVQIPPDQPSRPKENLSGIIPGTTFPNGHAQEKPISPNSSIPLSFPGPTINNLPTTIKLFSPTQLATSPLLPALSALINKAFASQGHIKNGKIVVPSQRLAYEGQLLDELSAGTGTFTYVVCFAGKGREGEVIGTASAKRYLGNEGGAVVQGVTSAGEAVKNTFTRFGPVAEGREMWELSTMAVDPGLQRQGLAGHLMRITEAEVRNRFAAFNREGETRRLVMALTTIKQVNEAFYARRGFVKDYEVEYPVGHIGSETGFTIIHMSREIPLEGHD